MDELLTDLRAETAELNAMVRGLDPAAWELPTPAEGWAVRDQIAHLAWFDDAATAAATDPEGFRAVLPAVLARGDSAVDELAAAARTLTAAQVHAWFRAARTRSLEAFARLDAGARLPWYGPDMSAASFVTARLMETWAHGQDVADALGVVRVPTPRLRHVATLGVRAMPYGFAVRGLPVPARPVRVELTMPDGSPWAAGPEDADDLVSGPMLDFCLLVVQRRHLADTALRVRGETARAWTAVAQAFAGPPGRGRPPRGEDRPPFAGGGGLLAGGGVPPGGSPGVSPGRT
ncbi:TIGR03084 family metal-binding protein [Streptosporangium fragile]